MTGLPPPLITIDLRCLVLQPIPLAVYIGDSITDIPPLISADAGILVGSNDLVRQVAAVAGAPTIAVV